MTGINRNTIMNLGVRVGQGCAALLDAKMRGLSCHFLQFDEVWGFIGKKQKHLTIDDDLTKGDVWTFCAIDAETKLVPAFKVGKRDHITAHAFVSDVASRLENRPQISTDGLSVYADAIDEAFGMDVDHGMIIKNYGTDQGEHHQERRYSAPAITFCEKREIAGHPNVDSICTSHVERDTPAGHKILSDRPPPGRHCVRSGRPWRLRGRKALATAPPLAPPAP